LHAAEDTRTDRVELMSGIGPGQDLNPGVVHLIPCFACFEGSWAVLQGHRASQKQGSSRATTRQLWRRRSPPSSRASRSPPPLPPPSSLENPASPLRRRCRRRRAPTGSSSKLRTRRGPEVPRMAVTPSLRCSVSRFTATRLRSPGLSLCANAVPR
jgi:hypothetical protein